MLLINTVGTSLLAGWKDLDSSLDESHRARMVAAVRGLAETDRKLGAELTSIHSLCWQGVIKPGDRLLFLVSDTREGAFVGKVLGEIVKTQGFAAESRTVHKLQGDDPKAFAQGLKNLVREIAMCCRTLPDGEPWAINATGGYKAQISFAGLIGQVFQVPVYYQFETFPTAIALPPLPVSFDLTQWLAYRHILDALNEGEDGEFLRADDSRVKALPESLKVLLDMSQGYATLNALGTLYHEGLKNRFLAQASQFLPKDTGTPPSEKKIIYEDRNPGKHPGLADWLEQIREAPYVTRIKTFYYNPGLPGRSTVEPDSAHGDRVIAIYAAHGATTKCFVFLSENDPAKAQAAAAHLAEWIR